MSNHPDRDDEACRLEQLQTRTTCLRRNRCVPYRTTADACRNSKKNDDAVTPMSTNRWSTGRSPQEQRDGDRQRQDPHTDVDRPVVAQLVERGILNTCDRRTSRSRRERVAARISACSDRHAPRVIRTLAARLAGSAASRTVGRCDVAAAGAGTCSFDRRDRPPVFDGWGHRFDCRGRLVFDRCDLRSRLDRPAPPLRHVISRLGESQLVRDVGEPGALELDLTPGGSLLQFRQAQTSGALLGAELFGEALALRSFRLDPAGVLLGGAPLLPRLGRGLW